MTSIALLVNAAKSRAAELASRVRALASSLNLSVKEDPAAAEAIVVLGGDGTLLSAVRRYGAGKPIVGLNAGSLGYLTCVEERQFADILRSLADGTFRVSRRRTLAGRVLGPDGGVRRELPVALNDITIARGHSARALKLALSFDGHPVAAYLCDGIVFATPTGSTAYALSAGGPVVLPGIEATVMAVISPHSLAARPLVYPDKVVAAIERSGCDVPWLVSADGQEDIELGEGERVEIFAGALEVPLVVAPDYDPLAVLRLKLGWSLRHPI
ncbi:MAG: NAD(+)/NADH kinase [Kiritimatiellia bacterium]